EALADPAAALLVDDAHLLDSALLGRIRAAKQARVIVAARPWPVPDGLGELAAALDGTAALAPLGRAEVGAHLDAVGVPARAGIEEFVLAQTGGVPAFVDRLARALDHDGPLDVPAEALPDLDGLAAEVLTFLIAADTGAAPHVDLLSD